jgi:hypothetical protein
MPTPPYAKLRVARNGGAPATGGIICAHADAIQLSLESTVGVGKARWEIYDYPAGFGLPAGWTEDPTTHTYYSLAITPPSFTLPAATNWIWGKYMLSVLVNDGDPGSSGLPAAQLYDDTTAIEIVGPSSLHGIGRLEFKHFDAQRGWIGQLNDNMRRLTGGARLRCVLQKSGNQALTAVSGFQDITWNTELLNRYAMHSGTNAQISALVAGLYRWGVAFACSQAGTARVRTSAGVNLISRTFSANVLTQWSFPWVAAAAEDLRLQVDIDADGNFLGTTEALFFVESWD